jgi:hypothetical protein
VEAAKGAALLALGVPVYYWYARGGYAHRERFRT